MITTKRAFLVEPRKAEIRNVDISPGPREIAVKVEVCGLCNWELNHWMGLLGTNPQPLGHEWAGTIVELGKDVTKFKKGQVVTGLDSKMAGFSEYLITEAEKSFLVDTSINPKHALGEPLKCIVTVLRAALLEVGDFGVIYGCGPMGLWCIQGLSGNTLSALIAVDIDEEKLALAKKYGATHIINNSKNTAKKEIMDITNGYGADFVIEGTGRPSSLNYTIDILRDTGRGRLVLMSSHEEITKEIDLREAVKKAIEIKVPHPKYSLNQHEDMRRAVNMINNKVFLMDGIISHSFELDRINEAFTTLEEKPANFIKGVVIP